MGMATPMAINAVCGEDSPVVFVGTGDGLLAGDGVESEGAGAGAGAGTGPQLPGILL